MDAIHLHLIANHVPVLGTIFATALLLCGIVRKSEEIKKISAWAFVLMTAACAITYISGESAAELLAKRGPDADPALIQKHHDAGEIAFTANFILGITSLAGLIIFRKRSATPGWFIALLLAFGLIVCALMGWTANLGGHIRHPEIRPAVVTPEMH